MIETDADVRNHAESMVPANWAWREEGRALLVPLVLVFLFLVWGAQHLAGYNWGWDESVLILGIREVSDGVSLYDPMWWNYPPLFFWISAAAFQVAGPSVAVARILALAWAGVAVLATAAVAARGGDGVAATMSALLLLLLPAFVEKSRPAMADIPVVALAMLALWAALRGRTLRGAAVAGAMFALALLTKQTALVLTPAVGLALLVGYSWRVALQRLGSAIVTACLVIAIVLLRVPLVPFIEQVVVFNASGGSGLANPAENLRSIWAFLTTWQRGPVSPLIVLALLAILPAVRQWRRDATGFVLLAAVVVQLTLFAVYSPLYSHLIVTVLPPLAALAGIGAAWVWDRLGALVPDTRRRSARIVAAAVGLVLLVWIYPPGGTYRRLAYPREDDKAHDGRLLAQELQTELPTDAFVLSDDPMINVLSGHSPPPALVNISSRRFIHSDGRPPKAFVHALQEQPPATIIFWTDRFLETPGMLRWVQQRYELVRTHDEGKRRIYRRLPAVPAFPQNVPFGDRVTLRGYDLAPIVARAGDTVTITPTLQIRQPPSTDLAFYVHVDGHGRRIGSVDQRLALPNNVRAGDHLRQSTTLTMAPDAPSGWYEIHFGVYEPATETYWQDVTLSRPLWLGNRAALFTAPTPERTSAAEWPSIAQLIGGDVTLESEAVVVTLYWRALTQPTTDAKVFVHLVADDGTIVAQSDSVPAGGLRPLTGWLAEEIITDTHRLSLPADGATGSYRLLLGLYEAETLERLPVHTANGAPPARVVSLGTVELPSERCVIHREM